MTQELGRMSKPDAAMFVDKKKLYIVPLAYIWPEATKAYKAIFDRYWQEVASQLTNLESRIGIVKRIYHESILETGETGLKSIEKISPPSYLISHRHVSQGAKLESIEDRELMQESLDWERFLMIGFSSRKVAALVSENFSRVMKSRSELISSSIMSTLADGEAGVLFVREGHMVQFPAEIEVFSVAPPSLDELHRFLRDQPTSESDVDECVHEHENPGAETPV